MSDIGEGLGTAVEGGLFAKVVSGGAGRAGNTPLQKGHFAENACLNCGTELIGSHCHSCGQQAHLHRTMGAFLHDLMHGALHFDGKTWRTLPKLFFKPGELTRRYIDGERMRFVSPMALFLFSIFLMFAVFQLAGISAPTDIPGDNSEELAEFTATELDRREKLLESTEEELAEPDLDPGRREVLERRQQEYTDQITALRQAQENVPFLRQEGTGDELIQNGEMVIPLEEVDGTTMRVSGSGVDWVDGAVEKWRKNPGLMLYKLQTNFYKFSWLLIPLSIPFVWLMFAWKRQYKAYDHAIFVTYSLSFMTLLTLGLTIAGISGISSEIVALASIFIPPIHIYKHLRGTYGLSRFSAIWRLALMSVFIIVILALFLQLLLVLGAF
ncbi:DUF3667 domain-containing protein [Qipengyuania nanhaisediminis]|uniref:DUF3667 domain-containing protein n=1 Tax=Qipengyuania nanhaisediminis TaxID=604088 RepID=A0A1I5KG95_9SPHN|nr:DUF3667 domain-containing protein [Qipengyuania nanhaisediminis]SFO83763.1 Protein of unknown function [Qipengyuania nanhaisediminis]